MFSFCSASPNIHSLKETHRSLNSWIGKFFRVFSAESTSTPPPLEGSGYRWSLFSGCWSLWWLLSESGATSRGTSTATPASLVAPTSAIITSSPSPTFAFGPSNLFSSLALHSWWCSTWLTGKNGNASTEPSTARTLGFTTTRDKSMVACGGRT